jgi:uncharacterized protein YggE
MFKRILILSLLMSASLLFGQVDSNTVTVTSSQSTNLQPDQVLFGVSVTTPLNSSLDDVLAVLKGSGITMANFSGVSSAYAVPSGIGVIGNQQPTPTLQWSFALSVPFAQMKATVTSLTSLEQSILQANSGFTLTFSVQGTQVSTSLLQSQSCNIAGLISDATAQAQKLASAAGMNLGAIVAMASAVATPVSSFTSIGALTSQLTTPQNCALTVKFAVTRF